MITIVTGARNAGKTRCIQNLIKTKRPIYGYISEKIIEKDSVIGYYVKNIITQEQKPLIHQTLSFQNNFSNRRFHFDLEGFRCCNEDLIRASQIYSSIVIDEIGKLELEKKLGFYEALEALLIKDINLIVGIRDTFLPQFIVLLETYNKAYEMIHVKSVGAVIMASGASTRFKECNKLLYNYKGETLFEHVLNNTLKSKSFSEIVVVSRYEEIKKICEAYKEVAYIHNENAHEGISSSIKLGTSYLKDKVDGYMYIQADQIFVSPNTLAELVNTFKSKEVEAIIPRFAGKEASPKIISSRLTDHLMALEGDYGGKSVIKKCKSIIKVDIKDKKECIDIDRIEDLPEET